MNYLAHLHLAKLSKTSYSGSLMADFCHASQIYLLPNDIQKGIKLHQFVDKTLDSHPLSVEFRAEQTIGRRRFAGIVQDLLMDYWLVKKWDEYNDISLAEFYAEFLPDLLLHQHQVKPAYQRLVLSLNENRWLQNLGTLKGIEKALMSIIRSWRYGEHLLPFYQALPYLLESSETLFDAVYPAVLAAVEKEALNSEGIKKANQ